MMRPETKTKMLRALTLRREGKTFREIGADLGVCRQHAKVLADRALRHERWSTARPDKPPQPVRCG